jgi:FixJ family two-component response regulator
MPSFDGLNVIEALRLVGLRRPIILITAFGDPETHACAATRDRRDPDGNGG